MADKIPTENYYTMSRPTLVSFPNLIKARKVKINGKETGKEKFSINFEFPADHPDLPHIKALLIRVAKEAWGSIEGVHFPISSGEAAADKAKKDGKEREWSRGRAVLVSRSDFAPKLGAILNKQLVAFVGDDRSRAEPYFYTGVEAGGTISVQAQTTEQGKFVVAYLNEVVSLNKGDRLTGGGSVEQNDTFKGYVGLVSAEDPTGGAGLDDEIPC